jgi:hypothetical protein
MDGGLKRKKLLLTFPDGDEFLSLDLSRERGKFKKF